MIKNENKIGYKKTELNRIPKDWDVSMMGEIGEFKNGINKDKDEFGYGYPFVNLMDIFGKSEIKNKDFALVNATKKELSEYCLLKGDVLFVRSSVKPVGVGLTSLILENIPDTTFSGFIIRFRETNNKIDFNYKKHCFFEEGFRRRLLKKSTISANTNINQVSLKKLYIPLPPLPEQKKIAKILSTWDDVIATTEKLIAAKEKLKKGLMQQLLTGKKRFKEFEGEEWKEMKLGKVCKFFDEQRKPIKQEDRAKMRGKIPYYGASGIIDYVNDYIFNEELILLGEDGENILSRNLPLIFQITGKSWVNNHAHVLRPNDDMDITYLTNYLESLDYKKYNTGTAQPKLTKNICKNIKVKKPCIGEQKKIASVLSACDKEIQTQKEKLNSLQNQKKGLMQQLLTGKVRVRYKV